MLSYLCDSGVHILMKNNTLGNKDSEKLYDWLNIYTTSSDKKEKDNAKTQVVNIMIPVVYKIAHTIARRANDPVEDMVQAGFIGLLRAIDKFSADKNDNFRVFAGYYIIGEMKHFLRDKLGAIKVPRHIQELSVRIYNFTKSLTDDELKTLTSEEVAYALNSTTASVDLALQMNRRKNTVYLDDVFNEPDTLGYEELIADENYENEQDYADAKIIFNDVIKKLPPDIQVIVDMYYKQNMNKKEIANALMLSPMCVTRRMKQAFDIISSMVIDDRTQAGIAKGNLNNREV